jgi:hypothetical protein
MIMTLSSIIFENGRMLGQKDAGFLDERQGVLKRYRKAYFMPGPFGPLLLYNPL